MWFSELDQGCFFSRSLTLILSIRKPSVGRPPFWPLDAPVWDRRWARAADGRVRARGPRPLRMRRRAIEAERDPVPRAVKILSAYTQTCKSLPRRVGGASRSSCRVLGAQVQPVITWGPCLRGRGSLWQRRLSTPPRRASRCTASLLPTRRRRSRPSDCPSCTQSMSTALLSARQRIPREERGRSRVNFVRFGFALGEIHEPDREFGLWGRSCRQRSTQPG